MKGVLRDELDTAWLLNLLDPVVCEQRDHERAWMLCTESLRIFQRLGVIWGIAECLVQLARVSSLRRQPEGATRLLASAESVRGTIGLQLPPVERTR